MSVWKRLQRVGKKAAKFQLSASYHSLTVDCSKSYQPYKLMVAWTRRSRRHATQPTDWTSTINNNRQCTVVWDVPELVEITSILYRDAKKSEYEDKEWTFVIEELDKNGRRKPLASRSINLKDFVQQSSTTPKQTQLTIKMKTVSKKVTLAVLKLTLHTIMLKEKDSDDESMISITSLMSLNRNTDVANLEDFRGDQSTLDNSNANEFAELFRKLSSLNSLDETLDEELDARLTASLQSSLVTTDVTDESQVMTEANSRVVVSDDAMEPSPQKLPSSQIPKPSSIKVTSISLDVDKSEPSPTTCSSSTSHDLLNWAREVTVGYKGVFINNCHTSFRNGIAFCAIIHHYRPDLIDMSSLKQYDIRENNRKAFDAAACLGIPRVLDPTEMQLKVVPDQLLILTYLHQLRTYFTCQQLQVTHVSSLRSSDSNYAVADLVDAGTGTTNDNVIKPILSKSQTDSSLSTNLSSKTVFNERQQSESPPSSIREQQNARYREAHKRAQKLLQEKGMARNITKKSSVPSKQLLRFNPDGTIKDDESTKVVGLESRKNQTKFVETPKLTASDSIVVESSDQHCNNSDMIELSDYVSCELAALDREQEDIDHRAQVLERQLRATIDSDEREAEREQLLTQWFQLVSKKNALIRRNLQLNMLAQEEDLERKHQLLESELRLLMSVDMKTEEHAHREERLLRELVSVVNNRDELVKAMDQHEQEIEMDMEIEREALQNVHGSRSSYGQRNCALQ